MADKLRKVATKTALAAVKSWTPDDIMLVIATKDLFHFDADSGATHDGTDVIKPDSLLTRKAGRWLRVKFKAEDVDFSEAMPAHKTAHENGGADEINVDGLAGELADPQPPIIGTGADEAVAGNDSRLTDTRDPNDHAANHVSGGGDAFLSTDLLEAIVKRLQTSTGPTTLTLGAIAAAAGSPYTTPTAAGFTALNSATLTDKTTDIGAGVHTNAPSTGATNTQRLKGGHKAMNYTSGTITLVMGLLARMSKNDFAQAGLFFREAGTGKIVTFNLAMVSGVIGLDGSDLSGPDGVTYVRQAVGSTTTPLMPPGSKLFFKATYDGANMVASFSIDMVNWTVFATVAKDEYFTVAPDQWGFYANANTGSGDVDATCFHFAVS
jgi:hypothetical protein